MRRFLSILSLLLLSTTGYAQSRQTDIIPVTPRDTLFQLSREFILTESDSVFFDADVLRRGEDYLIDYRHGTLRLTPSFRDARLNDTSHDTLRASYVFLPLRFRQEYALKSIRRAPDSLGGTIRLVRPAPEPLRFDDFFTPSLRKNGSLTRGFTIGSNRDLTLSSGFRMQLAGPLSRDVDLVAVLTDENTPLQPEGTTETLQEVDKVFVEVKHPSAEATLGDFNEEIGVREGGSFGSLTRKLQGAKGTIRSSSLFGGILGGRFSVAGGGARGKYHTNEFRGQEGNQGPYRLAGARGERQIIVVAGSERVYIDGVLMRRGEINDYTIDYAAAQIMFSTQRLITNASRIVVDFEYTDRHYERNFFSAQGSVESDGGDIRVSTLVVQEGDDPSSPVESPLSDEARAILAGSGDDLLKASLPGIRLVGRDSVTGSPHGTYLLKDTVLNGRNYSIAVYAPGDTMAVYSVTFSPVKLVPPDSAGYERVTLGHFRFAGLGRGTHLPLNILPLPSRLQFSNVNAEVNVAADLSLTGEIAGSGFDQNRLSALDDQDNTDGAYRFSVRYYPANASLAGLSLGSVDVRYSERYQGSRFVAPDRINEIEFGRKWNFDTAPGGNERIREVSASLRPVSSLTIGGTYGSYRRSERFRSSRLSGEILWSDSTLRRLHYRMERISSSDAPRSLQSDWLRHGGEATVEWGNITPGLRFEAEERTLSGLSGDSLQEGSFRFRQWTPHVESGAIFGMTVSAEMQLRQEDSTMAGVFRPAFSSIAPLVRWRLNEWNGLRAQASVSAKRTRFEQAFRARGNADSDVLAVRSVIQHSPADRGIETDLFYEFSNQRSARLERVYVRVPQGEGNYRYRGDINGNAVPDDNEFELTRFDGDYIVVFIPGETLYPVAEVKASGRIRIHPRRFIHTAVVPLSWLSVLSSETYVRVEERSSDPRTSNVALLRLGTFRNTLHTIAGSQVITQDLHVFEFDPLFSLRFRFMERKGLVQLVQSAERSSSRERSIRMRLQAVSEIGNETELAFRKDRVIGTRPGPRDRDLRSVYFSSDVSYRPVRDWEVGFRFTVENIRDVFGGDHAAADLNDQSVRCVYAFPGKGQLRGEVTREETILSQPSKNAGRDFPFEFTRGRLFGKSLLWLFSADYRVTANIQVSLQYTGRTEGGRSPVHTARAEAKAFF